MSQTRVQMPTAGAKVFVETSRALPLVSAVVAAWSVDTR